MNRNVFVGFVFVLCLSLAFFVGCKNKDDEGQTGGNAVISRNLQFTTLNSTGQIATTVVLDSQPLDQVEATSQRLVACLTDAKNTLNGELTLGNLGPELEKVIPAGKFRAYISQILILVEGTALPTDKIGVNNVKRITEFLDGAIYRAERYDKEAREKSVVGLRTTVDIKLHPDFFKK